MTIPTAPSHNRHDQRNKRTTRQNNRYNPHARNAALILLRCPFDIESKEQSRFMLPILQQYWPFLASAAAIVAALAIGLMLLCQGRQVPYEKVETLLTPAEINFLRSLELAVRSDWMIFSMVRLADVIKVRSKTRKSQTWQNRIFGKHLDFVLCDAETLEVKLAIELDDSSHNRRDRVQRDRFVNSALSSAGLPLLRISVEQKYETAAIRKLIEQALGIVVKKKKKW